MAKLFVQSGKTLSHRGHYVWLAGEQIDDDSQSMIGAENIQRLLAQGTLTANPPELTAAEASELIRKRGGAA